MTITKLERVATFKAPSLTRIPAETEETKNIRQLGQEIKTINAQTEALKKGEITKSSLEKSAEFIKRLNIL